MTLLDEQQQQIMRERIHNLSSSSNRRWGKMSVSQMLQHMSIAFSVPINKVQLPKDKLYYLAANPISRFLMIDVSPKWPKNMATVDAFIIKNDPEFETAKTDFLVNYNAFLNAHKMDGCHPAFGVMSKKLWGKAMYLHLNHHLEQFGV